MSSTAVEVLISADDQASKKFAQVAANAEQSVRKIKDVSQKAKASTEFAGVLANVLGGTQLGSFAGQVAQVTEKVGQFSEVSKAGGAGALAFKAGLVGLVGVASFQLGKAISDWIFQQKELNVEIDQTVKYLSRMSNEAIRVADQALADDKAFISLLPSEEQQDAELRKLSEGIATKLKAADEDLKTRRRMAATAETEAEKGVAAAQLASAENLVDSLKRQREEIERQLSPRQKLLQNMREIASQQKSSEAYLKGLEKEVELLQLTGDAKLRAQAAQGAFGDDVEKAFQLLKTKESILKAEEESKRVAQEKEQAERIAKDQEAKAMAAKEKQIEMERERQKALNAPTVLSGSESRLLSRGSGETTQKLMQEQVKHLADIASSVRVKPNDKSVKLKLVGAGV